MNAQPAPLTLEDLGVHLNLLTPQYDEEWEDLTKARQELEWKQQQCARAIAAAEKAQQEAEAVKKDYECKVANADAAKRKYEALLQAQEDAREAENKKQKEREQELLLQGERLAQIQASKQRWERWFSEQQQRQRQQKDSEAAEYLERFTTEHHELLTFFPNALRPILEHRPSLHQAYLELRRIELDVATVVDFLHIAAQLGHKKEALASYLGIQNASDFTKIAPQLSHYLHTLPPSGNCIALDRSGRAIAPWRTQDVAAWQWLPGRFVVTFSQEKMRRNEVPVALDGLNTGLCQRRNWNIPTQDEALTIDVRILAASVSHNPEIFWIRRDTALRGLNIKNGNIIDPAAQDSFFVFFISHER